jgi:hypothetical protein
MAAFRGPSTTSRWFRAGISTCARANRRHAAARRLLSPTQDAESDLRISMEVRMRLFNRRGLLRGAAGIAAALLAIQLVPYGRDHANPPVSAEPPWDSPATRALARDACFDCHSHQTQWPAYASVAPASWLVQYDVKEGREALNFSEWNRPQKEAAEAAEKVLEGEMPPPAYRLMHAHARLNADDRERLASGLRATLRIPRR